MLKKLWILGVGALFITDSFATTDIAANAESSTCDSGVLGATEGDVNFDAKWQANEVQLRWYNNNTLMQGVATASNTCDYDGALTIPATEPQRTGYTFGGWHVRPNFNFSTLTSLTTGSERWAHGYYQRDYYWHASGTGSAAESTIAAYPQFTKLEVGEWRVDYRSGTTKGTLYGSGYCSAKSGNHSDYTWPTATPSNWLATRTELEEASGEKKYCWCQATGWQPDGGNTLYGQSSLSSASSWVFLYARSSADYCAYDCAADCAYRALTTSALRRALFVGSGT